MRTILFLSLLTFSATISSCCKPHYSCYDAALAARYTDSVCTKEYAPVVGCDGKTYGNRCEALLHGIRPR